jgi:hypothetical protein
MALVPVDVLELAEQARHVTMLRRKHVETAIAALSMCRS